MGGFLAQRYKYLARRLLDECDLWCNVNLPGGGLLQRGRRGQDHLWGHRIAARGRAVEAAIDRLRALMDNPSMRISEEESV
jgi:hypothetical protein